MKKYFKYSKKIKSVCTVILVVLSGNVWAQALKLPSIFSDNMVLQQKTKVQVWGWASAGEEITVKPQWNKGNTVKADASGKWRLTLETPEAGGPYSMIVKGNTREITINNLLIGEVWLCSGQSNMEMPLKGWPPRDTVLGASQEIKKALNPSIRMYTVARAMSVLPLEDCKGSWVETTPEKVKEFSATAYFFGKKIYETLNVPVGLIHTSWGGTPIEAWISQEALEIYPEYKDLGENYAKLAGAQKEKTAWLEKHPRIEVGKNSTESQWTGLDFSDALCAQPSLYDFEWERMKLPVRWESTSLGEFDGAVWFRKTIDLPSSWNNQTLLLNLPGIDDMDQTWVNGVLVGRTEAPGYWQTPRRYEIPASLVKGEKLLIAIRVIDHQGGGGIWDTQHPMELVVKENPTRKISLAGYWRYLPVAELQNNVFYIFDSKTREYQMRTVTKGLAPGLPSVLFNAMIAPVVPYTLKGFLWYQGESNVGAAAKYESYMKAIAGTWRKYWREEIPFYFVQISPYKYTGTMRSESAELRYAQLLAQNTLLKSGMVVTLDIGDVNNIHPCKKKEVGERLAYWALAKEYDQKVDYTGPSYQSHSTEGNSIRIVFEHAEKGLVLKEDSVTGFAGQDQKYVKAEVRIEKNSVVVYSSKVAKPVSVRYAWYNGSTATLFNQEGFPASTFATLP